MKCNILYIFGGEKASGAEIVIERLISFNRGEVNPHLFISPGYFADKLLASKQGYPITLVNRLRKLNRSSAGAVSFYIRALVNYIAISSQVYKYIKKNNIHYVHTNTIVPASYILPLIVFSKITGGKTRWLWSDHDLVYFSKLDHFLSKQCVSLYNCTFVVSKAVAKKYQSGKKIQVLYNGLDTNKFKVDVSLRHLFRAEQKLTGDEIIIGMAAIISPRKGQRQLIEVVKEINKNYPLVNLILAGNTANDTPDYTEKVLKMLNDYPKVKYIGPFEDMPAFYNGCDIIVNNSNLLESEPLGTTIYEGMACGKVVVAANTGGTAEIIDDKNDGFLFAPEDATELYNTLVYLIENYKSIQNISKAAVNKVKLKFNIQVMAENYNRLKLN